MIRRCIFMDIPKDTAAWGVTESLHRLDVSSSNADCSCLSHCFIGFCQDSCVEKPKPRRPPGLQRPWRHLAQKTIQEQGEITDLAGHRPDMIQACAHRHDALGTQLAEGRLAGRHAAIRRWPNQRATGLCTQGPQAHAHGQGRGRPAAGATRRVREVPRIACGRRVKTGKLDGDRLSQDYCAGLTQGSDHRRVSHGWLMPAQRRSRRGGKSLHVNDVLDANRNPVQGPTPPAESCLTGPFCGRLTGSCFINQRPGVYGVFVLMDLAQALVEQVQRRQHAGSQCSGGINDGDRSRHWVRRYCCFPPGPPTALPTVHFGKICVAVLRNKSRAAHWSPLVHCTMKMATMPVLGLTDKSVP